MKRIKSFEIDHTCLTPGLYMSRKDGDVTTYDLRFVRPNTPPFLENGVMSATAPWRNMWFISVLWAAVPVFIFSPVGLPMNR